MCHRVHVVVTGQLYKIDSLLSLYVGYGNQIQVTRLGQQASLLAELSHWLSLGFIQLMIMLLISSDLEHFVNNNSRSLLKWLFKSSPFVSEEMEEVQ